MVETKQAPCILDNAELRVILSVLYTILEVVRCFDESTLANNDKLNKADYQKKYAKYKSLLRNELSEWSATRSRLRRPDHSAHDCVF